MVFVDIRETRDLRKFVITERATLLKFLLLNLGFQAPKEAFWITKPARLHPKEEWFTEVRVHSGEPRCLWFVAARSLALPVEGSGISVGVRLHLGLRWVLLPGQLPQFSPCDLRCWWLQLQEVACESEGKTRRWGRACFMWFSCLCAMLRGTGVSDKRYLGFEGTGMQRVGKTEMIKPLDRVYYRTQMPSEVRGPGR